MIEMEYNVSGMTPSGEGVMFLQEKDGERYLGMKVLVTDVVRLEAKAVQASLSPLPLTHELIWNVIKSLEAKISYALITGSKNGICYANLFLKVGNEEIPIDCRPSDAVLLCLNTRVPIYVQDGILEEVSSG